MAIVMKAGEPAILKAAELISKGGTVVVPTDTNYNVVCSPYAWNAVERIFSMKHRESASPLTLFLGDSLEFPRFAYTTPLTELLAKQVWPEKLSMICWQKPTVPHYVTRGFGTVAVTLHANPIQRRVAQLSGLPLAGTSANLSGTGNVPDVAKAVEHLGDHVDLIIDDGLSKVDGANTIVDFTFEQPLLARAGAYPVERLRALIPNLKR
jgi:L-threonylcarbamoyladenylate synthase